MHARLLGDQLHVTINHLDIDALELERRTIGQRYGAVFDEGEIPPGFSYEGKLTVAPLAEVREDLTGQLKFTDGKVEFGTPEADAFLDTGGDLRLFVSDSFFYEAARSGAAEVHVPAEKVDTLDPEQLGYLGFTAIHLSNLVD